MSQSEKTDLLAAALAKAQGQIEGAVKDSTNPHFKSKYADLASVWDACRKPLSENGLSVVQMPGMPLAMDNGQWVIPITTTLLHSSGQWITQEGGVVAAKADGQGVVAATTYGRRAALAAAVGVAPVDDDGEEAVGRKFDQDGNELMPQCDHPGCTTRARYPEGAKNFCGVHRPNRPAMAARNPENGKAATAARMGEQEKFRKAINMLVETAALDSVYADWTAKGDPFRKKLIKELLGVPDSFEVEVAKMTLEQWKTVNDKVWERTQPA